jgi:DNA-binding NarL/FixJ family response regulator
MPENKTTPIRVVIIDDKQQSREILAALINGTEGFQCTDTFDSLQTATIRINIQNTDLVLAEIGLLDFSAMQLFKNKFPNLRLLVLSVYEDDDRIFQALCAGASGYLLKKTLPAQLLDGLREAVNGGAPISPEVANKVITIFREIRPPQNSDYELTPHETRLLKLLIEGHNYKTAAAELEVIVNTISTDLKHIYEKLQVHSQSSVVVNILRNRLIK